MNKYYPIKINAHMYTLHSNVTLDKMKESGELINDVQIMLHNIHSYLRNLGINSIFRQKSFEHIDVIGGISQLGVIDKTNVPISVTVSVDSKLVKPIADDIYRESMLSVNNDSIWFPAYIQINNIFTRGKKFNSFWTADLFIEDLMKALETATKQDYENGILVQDHLVIFDESKFESNRIDVVY